MGELKDILFFIKETEKLKDVTRTAWTSSGKRESVAEHSWRLAVFALSMAEYFPGADLARVLGMCLVHDFGEIYEGDVSAKQENDPAGKLEKERKALDKLTDMLPEIQKTRLLDLWAEYNAADSEESKLVKALDKMETIVQHNQGMNPPGFDYGFNLSYGADYAKYNDAVKGLRALIDRDTEEKCGKCGTVEFKPISSGNRDEVNGFIRAQWFSTDMVVRGAIVDMTKLGGFVAYADEKIAGLITYLIKGGECEIMSLDSLRERQGIGTALVNMVIKAASGRKCGKIKLITTNDNINAIGFYQKRGFDMTRIYHDSMEVSRKLKPEIPLLGDFNIPLRHEIEFEMNLPD